MKLVRAPAKLNLGLRVLGRREDGYHLIESLFVPLDLADLVAVSVELGQKPAVHFALAGPAEAARELRSPAPSPAASVSVASAVCVDGVPPDETNLAARAARAFLRHTGATARVEIRLEKRIPTGAGLGGGSSDAGAVLRCLSAAIPVPGPDLAGLALELGADVPYFLDPRPALVTGIGESIAPVEGVRPLALLLAHPGIFLATADVYRAWDELSPALTPARAGSTMLALRRLRADPEALPELLAEELGNDLQPAAVRLCPEVAQLSDRLRVLGAEATGMSGSGATVFGLFPDVTAAQSALDRAGFEPPIWAAVAEACGPSSSGASPNW